MSNRKLPKHSHLAEDLLYPSQIPRTDIIPALNWAQMAFTTWADFITQVGAWTVAQIGQVLTNWTNMISALGNLAWTQITKTATDVVNTIANWANIIASFGAWTVAQILGVLTSWTQVTNGSALGNFPIAKLDIPPYKLETSAYNYIVNGSFEYGTWGGGETQSTDYAKFGKYSAKLVAAGTNMWSGYSNYIDVRGLASITISTFVKITALTTGNFIAKIEYYNSAKTAISDEYIWNLGATQDWTQQTLTKTSFPANTAYARVIFAWHNGSGNPTGTAYVDGWQINVGDQIPTFQDFTTYSYNWMPDKIETTSTTTVSWSSDTWTNVLELSFECESTQLCIIFATIDGSVVRSSSGYAQGLFQLTIDGTELPATLMSIGADSIVKTHDNVSIHTVAIVEKGSHTLRIRMSAQTGSTTVYAFHRRLSILKSFYQGGTT